jgi:hypothetical protein
MAVKKSTANQREDRTPAPKIPAVIAKPTAKPAQTLNVYGSPSTNARPVVTPKPSVPKTSAPKIPAPKTNAQIAADAQKILDQLDAMGKRLDTLYTQDGKTKDDAKDDAKDDVVVGEDPSLVFAKMQEEKARVDAFALLKDVFASYGLSELADQIAGYMREGIGTGEATVRLKQSQPYKDRFYGNELRLASGRNVIDEASYLDLENSYSETLKAYGLQDYFGVGVTPTERKNRQKAIANVIGADISAVEFKDRVSTAVDRVKMADPATKSAFQQFYGIGETELAKYFLDPTKTLVTLKEKATAAEIGGAAIGQGLPATMASAEELARFGISREQAQIGYSTIADELPTAGKLGQIYSQEGITYGQTEAEQATFKGLASAKRKKEQLVEREKAAFQGSSGVAEPGLSTTYMRRSSSAGYF